jgi:hypothetical protein
LKLPGVSLSLHCVPFPETVPYFCVSVQGFTPALRKLFEAKSTSAPCGFSSSEYSGGTRTRNPSVNSRRIQNLNGLFGIACRERQRFFSPSVGLLGLPKDKMIAASVESR